MMFSPLLQIVCAVGPLRLLPGQGRSPWEGQDDATLVRLVQNGDRGAMHVLYRRHAASVLRRSTRLLARSAEAEDVAQDAFVEAFRDLHKLQEPARFGHWLMSIVAHQAQRRFRRHRLLRRLGLLGADDAGLEHLVEPSAGPEVRLQCVQLDRALQKLAPAQRVVWVLRFVEGCSLPEIAEYQGCSLATVKRQLGAATSKLVQYTDFELPPPETAPHQSDLRIAESHR